MPPARLVFLLAATLLSLSCASTPTPTPPQQPAYLDIGNRPADPFATNHRATVLLFLAHDCPVSNAYAPEIHRLCDTYEKQGIAFYIVYPDPDLTPTDAQQHHKDYNYTCPALLDPHHTLVQKAGATITPEAAVFLPDQTLVYRGRIDDLHLDYAKSRQSPTTRDLQAALDRITQNQLLTPTFTQAVGCHIPDPK